MAGFTTNKRSNHEIEGDTGYVRAGQGGKRHRFDLSKGKKAAPKDKLDVAPKGASALDGLGDLGGMSDMDGDPNTDMMSGEGFLDHDVNSAPEPDTMAGHSPATHPPHNVTPHAHAPVAVHIHLSPSDHKAFSGMARKPRKK